MQARPVTFSASMWASGTLGTGAGYERLYFLSPCCWATWSFGLACDPSSCRRFSAFPPPRGTLLGNRTHRLALISPAAPESAGDRRRRGDVARRAAGLDINRSWFPGEQQRPHGPLSPGLTPATVGHRGPSDRGFSRRLLGTRLAVRDADDLAALRR